MHGCILKSLKFQPCIGSGPFVRLRSQGIGIASLEACQDFIAPRGIDNDHKTPGLAEAHRRRKAARPKQAFQDGFWDGIAPEASDVAAPTEQIQQFGLELLIKVHLVDSIAGLAHPVFLELSATFCNAPSMARVRTKLLEYLAVTESDGNTSVRLSVAIDAHVGLRCRKAVFYQRMRTEFGRHGISINSDSDGEMLVAAPAGIEGGLDDALVRIDKAIGQFRNQPMTPRMVEEVLSITKQERSRWSKDGRLRRSGTASFKRGQAIQIYTHSPEVVAALADDPTIIASWRAEYAAKVEPRGG
jgi:hypothetical protein